MLLLSSMLPFYCEPKQFKKLMQLSFALIKCEYFFLCIKNAGKLFRFSAARLHAPTPCPFIKLQFFVISRVLPHSSKHIRNQCCNKTMPIFRNWIFYCERLAWIP